MSDEEVMKLLQIAEPLPDIIRRAYAAGLDQAEHVLNMKIEGLRLIYRGIDASYLESARDAIRKMK